MKILLLTSEYPPRLYGGLGRYSYEVYQNLKNSYEIDVLCVPTYQVGKNQLLVEERGMKVEKKGPNKVMFFFAPEVKEFLLNGGSDDLRNQQGILKDFYIELIEHLDKAYDVVYVQDYYISFLAAFFALNNMAKKVISCIHLPLYAGFTYFDKPVDDELHQALEAILIRFSNKIIVPSIFTKRVLIQIYNINPSKILAIPLGVRLIAPSTNNGIGKGNSNSLKKLNLLTVSRFTEQKGLTYIFEFILELVKNNIDFKYNIIGVGAREDDFEKLVKKHNLASQVNHIKYVEPSRMFAYYQEADIYISTSAYETFGLAILEAMSQGCIPIAFNISAIKELIQHNKTGILVGVSDAKGIATHIQNFYHNPNSFETMRKEAIKFASQFTWENHIVSLTKVFEECLNER